MSIIIESIGDYTDSGGFNNQIDIAAPSGVAVGDLLVAHLSKDGGSGVTYNTPSGWTLLQQLNQASLIVSAVFYKVAEAGDVGASTFTFTFSSDSNSRQGRIFRISGQDSAVPIITSSITGATNSSTVSASTVTPAVADTMIMFFAAITPAGDSGHTISGYTMAVSPPTFTEHYDDANGSESFRIAAASGIRPELTATGTISATITASDPNVGIAIVINPETSCTVTTQAVSNIDFSTATGNGEISDDGGSVITERGIVWSLTTTPTTSNFKSVASGTVGVFTASMTGLTAGTLYYVRAYGTNAAGTSYGNQVTFTTLSTQPTQIYKDIDGIEGETYAVSVNIGGTLGTLTVSLGSTGTSQTFAAGAGVSVLQGVYGGLNGLIFTASATFDGYIDDVMWVIILGTATIDWTLDSLTNVYPIDSSVIFRRIESKDFNSFRIYRILDTQFKDLDAYVTVLLKKEANEELVDVQKPFLVSNTSEDTLPFINKRVSILTKNQAIRIGFSNARLNETFTICQFIVKGMLQPAKLFDKSKITSV